MLPSPRPVIAQLFVSFWWKCMRYRTALTHRCLSLYLILVDLLPRRDKIKQVNNSSSTQPRISRTVSTYISPDIREYLREGSSYQKTPNIMMFGRSRFAYARKYLIQNHTQDDREWYLFEFSLGRLAKSAFSAPWFFGSNRKMLF